MRKPSRATIESAVRAIISLLFGAAAAKLTTTQQEAVAVTASALVWVGLSLAWSKVSDKTVVRKASGAPPDED